jgi:hypothetical protein
MTNAMQEAYKEFQAGKIAFSEMEQLVGLYEEKLKKYVEAELANFKLPAQAPVSPVVQKVKDAAQEDEAALASTEPAMKTVSPIVPAVPAETAAPTNIPVDPLPDTTVPVPSGPPDTLFIPPAPQTPPEQEISL